MTETMADLELVGGRPSLDFVNTEGSERNGPPERLGSYADLLAWGVHAGVLEVGAAERLDGLARARPEEAGRVLARAVALREALYRTFAAVLTGAPPAPADRQVLDRELGEALSHRRLVPAGRRFEWRVSGLDEHLDGPLWPIVDDAAELLTSELLERVKECGGERCTWLFLDVSRNRSRRWCDMRECGNRAKARRFRRKHG